MVVMKEILEGDCEPGSPLLRLLRLFVWVHGRRATQLHIG